MGHRNMVMDVSLGMTGVPFEAFLEVNKQPLDLSGCTVEFRMKKLGAATYKVDAMATPDPDQTVGGRRGWMKYEWQAVDVDTKGQYNVDLIVTLIGGRQIRFPTLGAHIPFAMVIIS